MTPAQETALIAVTVAGLDDDLRAAMRDLVQMIRDGMPPRDAVQQVLEAFRGEMADTLAVAFAAITAEAVGAASVLQMRAGAVSLSTRLYEEAAATAQVVEQVVDRHVRGFQDARSLALELYEGYGFREPGAEPLKLSPRNDAIPQYMRRALLTDQTLANKLNRALAGLQVDGLTTEPLKAAYRAALDAIEQIENGAGAELLEKRLRVAFFEKMRFFARRIAETELHRAFAQRQAVELLDDPDVEWVQWRLSPAHPRPDICDYLASVDKWGLGPGVYPVREAPVGPAHPFCKCVLSPRLDLTGRTGRLVPGAAQAVFRRWTMREGGQIAGSQDKLAEVLAGADALTVHNARINPAYRVRTVEETAATVPA